MEIINEGIKKRFSDKGITLIALVVTIIVLLILAGVTIATLNGNNGILMQANKAKEETEIGNEKEIIKRAAIAAKIGTKNILELEEENFRTELEKEAGTRKVELLVNRKYYEVYFKDSKRYYEVDKEGNVEEYEIATEISDAGDITKGGTLDGSEKPYEISCIEDLVALSYSVNGIQVVDGNLEIATSYNTFSGKQIILTRNLNFVSRFSYKNSERTDYGDINNNGTVEPLIEELTTGKGWIPIGGYANSKNAVGFGGTFDGKEKEIKNMYTYNEEQTSYIALFGRVCNTNIKNLGVTGEIYCNSATAGGIISSTMNLEVNIENCYFKGKIENVNTSGTTGGIAGNLNGSTTNITNCYSKGEIIGDNKDGGNTATGGIVGRGQNAILKIENSYNESNVVGISKVGGIIGQGGGNVTISNCYNTGTISGDNSVGGILGYSVKNIERCYNTGKVIGTENETGGIAGAIYAGSNERLYQCYNAGEVIGAVNTGGILGEVYAPKYLVIEQCYNIGKITGTTKTTGIVGGINGPYAKVLNCYNTGNIVGNSIAGVADGMSVHLSTAKIVSCYNIGKLDSSNSPTGVAGRNTYNSYYLENCGATDTVAIATGASELKTMNPILDKTFTIDDDANTVTINDEGQQDVWIEDENNQNDGYPILKWQTE